MPCISPYFVNLVRYVEKHPTENNRHDNWVEGQFMNS